jgi:PAS domain S-box-containing protein
VTDWTQKWVSRLRAGALSALVLVFLLAGFYGIFDVTQQVNVLSTYFRTGTWIASQVQAEYLQLYQALAVYQAEPSAEHRSALDERFEVFWSRLPVALEGDEAQRVREVPGAESALRSILAQMPQIEAQLGALQPGDKAAYERIADRLETFRQPLSDIALATIVGERALFSESTLKRRTQEIALSVVALFFAGAVSIGLVLRGNRLNRALYLQARQSAAELDTVKSQLVDAIESISEGFALFDRDERLVLANSRFKQFYSSVADVVRPGATLTDLVTEAVGRGQYKMEIPAAEWIGRRLERWRNPAGPFEQPLADGRVLRINDRRTAQGGYVSVRSDITEAKRAERVLEDRLAAIEASQDGLAILDGDGRYVYLNNSQARLHGFGGADRLTGTLWQNHYDEPERERFRTVIFPALRQSGSWHGDAVGRRRDGSSFPQEISLRMLDKGGIVCVVRDVTSRQQADGERDRLREQFHFAQRSEALGRLAGGVAHDFNNILGIMMGFAELTADMLDSDDPARPNLDKILAAGRRAKNLVQQILAYSRQAGSERHPLRMDLLLKETANLLRATLPATIALVKRFDGVAASVLADASQIDQVVMNLCVNAMQAIGDKRGRLEISLEDAVIGEGLLPDFTAGASDSTMTPMKIAASANGRAQKMWIGHLGEGTYIRVSISDDGCGMDPATLRRIFDPFFTTKPVGSGTGLGLAAVLGIVTGHGGGIIVETETGVGTRFEIYLPSTPDAAAAQKAAARAPRAAGHARVLVVDDEGDLAMLTCAMLKNLGYQAASCTDPTKAWALFRDDPQAFDLLITDQMMPHMSGDELAQSVRSVRADLPIILCTGFNARLSEARLREIGARAILLKPLPRDELAHAVATALQPAA